MITVRQATTTPDITDVRNLMRAFIDWHRERHHQETEMIDRYFDPQAFETELMGLPGEFAAPAGRLLLAVEGDKAAGCVALHDLGNGVCEMKRMFVYTEFHGKGVGRILAEAIIGEAKAIGYNAMRLDTSAQQTEAQGLYRKFGFKPIDAYYDLPDDMKAWLVFMELDLTV